MLVVIAFLCMVYCLILGISTKGDDFVKKLGLNEIRDKFLDFFDSVDHLTVRSYPLVPQEDKSLLFIVAGMVPLKNYFSGLAVPPKNRMATVQKCIRTNDIDNVGHTARHASFFEMLGNFSFGDYFKKEAIRFAWDFSTKTLGLPSDRIWVSVYEDDDEAFQLWQSEVGMPAHKIVRLGKDDNFWEIGTGTGPCGPCSELFFDRGEKYGCDNPDCKPGCDCDRYIEYWNLVFTQFDKQADGSLIPLEHPNIDTGMGLERIACIMQDVDSIFDVDTFQDILRAIENVSGKKYGENPKDDVSMRIITDHIRAVTFIVTEGVTPDNEGRGYVLRMLFRRAVRHGKLLGIDGHFMAVLADAVIDIFGASYTDLVERREYTKSIIDQEEERFYKTLDSGLKILDDYIEELKLENKDTLSGEKAFKLYDTYGFPLDLTTDILKDYGFAVDLAEFDLQMQSQRERARAARSTDDSGWDLGSLEACPQIATDFVGYDNLETEAELLFVASGSKLGDNETVFALFDKSPFYTESGGQVSDSGRVYSSDFDANLLGLKKLPAGQVIHELEVKRGRLNLGDRLSLEVDRKKRYDTMKNHTATHLLHKALRDLLGDGVAQAGSLVDDNKLRFDFTCQNALTRENLDLVEKRVNEEILKRLPVSVNIMRLEDAKASGAMALFSEKYSDDVRVVKAGEYSTELCGGTHVENTGDIGIFRIVSETAAAAGVRRIEAITGRAVYELMREEALKLREMMAILKAQPDQLIAKLESLIEEKRDLQLSLKNLKADIAGGGIDEFIKKASEVNGVLVVGEILDNLDQDSARTMADEIANREQPTLAVLAVKDDDKVTFVVKANKGAVENGIHSGKIAKELAAICGGGGGGRADMAQAGGKNVGKLGDAMSKIADYI